MATPEVIAEQQALVGINADYKEKFGFHDSETGYAFKAPKGLTRELVEQISEFKNEPAWMREFRLKALEHFLSRPQPTWGSPLLAEVDYDNIHYFVRASEKSSRTWDDVPDDIKRTFDRLGIPEAERKFLAGVGAQYESEVVYHQVREDLEKQGVVFMDMDSGLREHEDLVREYFATVIPSNDNKLAALNSRRLVGRLVRLRAAGRARRDAAAGLLPHQHREHGPVRADADHRRRGLLRALRRGLHRAGVDVGLAALRRRRADRQAGRADPLHDRAELVAERLQPRHEARDRAERDATVEWVDCNLGSKLTMKYPSVYLMGERAHGEILSIAFAGNGQHQDAGGKIIHAAPNTTSNIFAKSISKDGGRSSLPRPARGRQGRAGSKSTVVCDALLLDEDEPLGHLPDDPDRRGRRQRRPRGVGLEDRRGAALLPDGAAASPRTRRRS